MEALLEPVDQLISSAKNATRLSRLCEGLIHTFLAFKATQARVRDEKIDADPDDLYQSLYAITRRKAIVDRVKVRRHNGKIYLIRRKTKDGRD